MQVQVAAFAVSTYSPYFHRPGRKPFNPILGETYECMHSEKNFKFIAEQVGKVGHAIFCLGSTLKSENAKAPVLNTHPLFVSS